jgi:hypothetical protein
MDWSYRDFPGTTVCPPPYVECEGEITLEEYFKRLQKMTMADDKDMVNSPSHYTQGEIECIDAIAQVVKDLDGMEAMCTGNAIKYLWRWKHKNGVEDLKKAQWYLQRMIDNYEKPW